MKLRLLVASLALLLLSSAGLRAETRMVELQMSGVTALADLVVPDNGSIKNGVILITHGTLAHKDMELVEALQSALAERGVATLAHTLTLGVDRRKGMYDCTAPHTHRHEDAVNEIDAWIAWLKGQGAGPLTVLGHSRGGTQTAWFASERAGPEVARAVLIAPLTAVSQDSAATGYRKQFKADLTPILDKAKALAAAGKGSEMMELPGFIYCPDAKVRASSVVSYYGEEPRQGTTTLLPRLKMPALVIAASKDTVVPNLVERVKPIADGKKIRLEVIEDADHLFLDFYAEDAADLIAAFVTSGS